MWDTAEYERLAATAVPALARWVLDESETGEPRRFTPRRSPS